MKMYTEEKTAKVFWSTFNYPYIFRKTLTLEERKHNLEVISAISSVSANFNKNNEKSEMIQDCGGLTNFLRIYFNFAYYLGMAPFRIVHDDGGSFRAKKSRVQQILCAFMNILCIVRLLTEIKLGFRDLQLKKRKTPVEYFENIMNFFSLAYKTVTMKRFWQNQNNYLEIITTSKRKFQRFHYIQSKIVNPWIVHGIFFIFTTQCFINLITGKNFIVNVWTLSPKRWIARIIGLARYTFFFDPDLDINTLNSQNSTSIEISLLDGFLGFVTSIAIFQRYVWGFFCDLCIFSCAITLWAHANSFARTVAIIDKKESCDSSSPTSSSLNIIKVESSWSKVYDHFRAIQKLSQLVNGAMGNQVTLYIAESIVYYSLNLNTILTTSNPFRRADMICFYLLTAITFIVAADIGSQMEAVKLWIYYRNNRFKIPSEEMNIVLHEMLSKDIGIRGSNVFTMTYPFLSAVLSTTVTIFIISVQSDERGGTEASYLAFANSKNT